MFEIIKTFTDVNGLQITPIMMDKEIIFSSKELEGQLGYVSISDSIKDSPIMREEKDYIKLDGDNLKNYKELCSKAGLTRFAPINVNSLIMLKEPGIYKLLLRSDKEKCQKFANWVVDEVLPSIRKHGSYSLATSSRDTHPLVIINNQLIAITNRFLDIEEEQKKQQSEQIKLLQEQVRIQQDLLKTKQDIDIIKSKQSAILDDDGFFSVQAFANLKGIKITKSEAAVIGKRATFISNQMGIKIGKISDGRYGKVNSYTKEVLDMAFNS